MTTDRELLELAAKAVGYSLAWKGISGADMPNPIYFDEEGVTTGETWNPLTDDGDAFRLAVKLGMCVEILRKRMEPFTRVGNIEEEHRDNAERATRRAITRAAAAIGKAKGDNYPEAYDKRFSL